MSIVLKEQTGPQVPAGAHLALCHRIVDIGTQPDTGFGERHKIIIFWELPHEKVTWEGKEMPMGISKIYSASLNKKANLRKDLTAWRGRDFTKAELESFELKAILGKPCQLQVQHNEQGRANVAAVISVAKGIMVPPLVNPLVEYGIDEGRNETYARLPEWVQKMCNACLEWNGEAHVEPEPPATVTEEGDPEVPF